MPAQKRGRSDEERGPPWPRPEPGQGSKNNPIGWFQIQTFDLTAQHRDLVPQHHDLDFLRPIATHAQHDQLQHLAQDQVSERHDHAGQTLSCPRGVETLADQLQRALNTRVVIEQAKGAIANAHQIGVDAAFDLLRSHARSHHQQLTARARAVVRDPTILTQPPKP